MKKTLFLTLLLLLVLVFSTACSSSEGNGSSDKSKNNENQVTTITGEEAKLLMDESEVTIVDVRTQEEYQQQHIPQATLVPLSQLESGNFEDLPDKDATLLVYCRSGNRSATASEILVQEGYSQVYDFGGINDWPYEVE